MTLVDLSRRASIGAWVLLSVACRTSTPLPIEGPPADVPQAVGQSAQSSGDEAAGDPAMVFQLPLGAIGGDCVVGTLHGLDGSGEALWSKACVQGEVRCSETETEHLARLWLEHPHVALRQGIRFSTPPSGSMRLDFELFGDCTIELDGLTAEDIGSYLVLRRRDDESFLEAAFNGRVEVLESLRDMTFRRLPIGRYSLGLFDVDPMRNTAPPRHHWEVRVRPCQESVIQLSGHG